MKTEIWKDVPGYEDEHQVSSLGRVLSKKTNRILKPGTQSRGYHQVVLRKDKQSKSFLVHRLVLMAFCGMPEGDRNQTRHLNGIKTDNCTENLKWGTGKENTQDRIAHGNDYRGEKNSQVILTEEQALIIRNTCIPYKLAKKRIPVGLHKRLADKFGVSIHVVREISNGRTWTHLELTQ